MSDTPRVDSYVYKFPGCQREPRLIDFARKLERELAEARAEILEIGVSLAEKENQLSDVLSDRDDARKEAFALSDGLQEARAEIERLKAPALNASLLREKLAELAHNQWAGWMEYLFFKSKQVDGCVVIPAWANERWRRQVATRYTDLSEEEKDSDRSEADKFLAVFNAQLAERDELRKQLADARAEIERLENAAGELLRAYDALPKCYPCQRKDKLIEQMREALESVRQKHYVNDDDNWYSCPASGLCSNDHAGTDCNCGADHANSIIQAALRTADGGE